MRLLLVCFCSCVFFDLASVCVLAETPSKDVIARPGRESSPAVVNPATRSRIRSVLDLNGTWDFCIDAKLKGESAGWHLPDVRLPSVRAIQVPGCWEAQGVGEPGLSSANNKYVYEPTNVKLRAAYTGAAWYKKIVAIPTDWTGKRMWLKLGGVNAQGWMWVNGTFVGHDWMYCGACKYDITDLVTPGKNATVAILVRNDVPSRRGEVNCVRAFGGIFRGVEIEATPSVLIDNAYAEPLFDQKKVRLHVLIRNVGVKASDTALTLAASVRALTDNSEAGKATSAVSVPASAVVELTLDVPLEPFLPWSPESPLLYKAELTLAENGRVVDGWGERFGMKKFEVRNGEFFLNNARYFLRGCGDDYCYPMTVCSPASREEHAKHLRIAKQYGFNYIRLHTHCENPEYFEAADEVGLMVQPELPYYGRFNSQRPYSHMSGAPLMAKEDLAELVLHMRRYTSLATYCGGNEGTCPTPLDRELFKMAKQLDPSRPWLCMDGASPNEIGHPNTRENSEINANWGLGSDYHPPISDNTWPHVLHEFMSLGLNEDPRLESKFTGAFAPTKTLQEAKTFVTEHVGLDWKWAEACWDAGHRLQGVWHKIGIESARNDPLLDGFICWLMIDMSPSTQNGVLNMFWEKKHSAPDDFRQFNTPTVILARNAATAESFSANPQSVIHSEGDVVDVDWFVSHFQREPLKNRNLLWQLTDGGQTMASGSVGGVTVQAGGTAVVGRSRITMPKVTKAVKAKLAVSLDSGASSNSWDLWIFPKLRPEPNSGNGMAVSPSLFNVLKSRYPGLTKLGDGQAGSANVVVIRDLNESGVIDALKQGKNVLCLSLPGGNPIKPGVRMGWWQITSQTGTAIAHHPAFGDFPHDGFLDAGWFRMVDTAEKLDPGHKLRGVEPLMVGIGRETGYSFGTLGYPLGFNLYAFQARAEKGKLLAAGLNLISDNPESVYLLDQFIRYVRSDKFAPQGHFNTSAVR
jgi:hypothetical protein